jgi:hypothetical protein
VGQLRYQASSFYNVKQREDSKLGLLFYVLHKDHGRNLGGKAKGKVCTCVQCMKISKIMKQKLIYCNVSCMINAKLKYNTL